MVRVSDCACRLCRACKLECSCGRGVRVCYLCAMPSHCFTARVVRCAVKMRKSSRSSDRSDHSASGISLVRGVPSFIFTFILCRARRAEAHKCGRDHLGTLYWTLHIGLCRGRIEDASGHASGRPGEKRSTVDVGVGDIRPIHRPRLHLTTYMGSLPRRGIK